jgi:hypothetical protein
MEREVVGLESSLDRFLWAGLITPLQYNKDTLFLKKTFICYRPFNNKGLLREERPEACLFLTTGA